MGWNCRSEASRLEYMATRKAIVQDGQVILDGIDYPDGTELEIVIVSNDEMSAEERERLFESIDKGIEDYEQGRAVPASSVLAEMRSQLP